MLSGFLRCLFVAFLLSACLWAARASQVIVTLSHSNGPGLAVPAQPSFGITASLPNPSIATDANGNTRTDALVRMDVLVDGWLLDTKSVSNNHYSAQWLDPRGNLWPCTLTYTVKAMGNHYQAYQYWVDGHWEEDGYWEYQCYDVEDGYWDDDGNWVTDGSHEECGDVWVETSEWVDAHWVTGFESHWVSFGEASMTFYLTMLQGTVTLTPLNGTTGLASPAQPKFTISASLGNARTVTDGLGNTRTDSLTKFEIHNPSYGWFSNITASGGSQSTLWSDPRSNLSASTQTYSVYTWGLRWDSYDYGWIDGYWHEDGYWEWQCNEVEEGYWDDDGNWVVEGTHEECGDNWVGTDSWWVDGHYDTGFESTLELISRQDITFIITTGVPQTITFPAIGTHSWGEAPFALAATASSGLPVSYVVSSGPATVSGNIVSLTGTGSVTILASQPGNSTYSAATPVSRTFRVIAGQPQTITFPPIANRAFGDPPFSLSATASSGLPVSYAVTAGYGTVSGSTAAITGGGTITVTATQSGNATYGPATAVSRSFSVAKASQTIEFSAISDKAQGDAPFPLAAVASPSLLPVSFAVVSGSVAISGNMATVTEPGTVTIRAWQHGDHRYSAAPPVDRIFNVGLGPNGHSLTVQNGTASTIGGDAGAVINITANIPSGQYFAGWIIDAGDGYILDAANPSTTFTMGAVAATVRAALTTSPPTYSVGWTQMNAPSTITASDGTFGPYVNLDYGGIVTNTGTGPLSRSTLIEVLDNSNQLVGFGMFVNGVSGLAVGQSAPLWFIYSAPNTPATYAYTVRVRIWVGSTLTQIGSTYTTNTTVTARTGTPPQIDMQYRSFTGAVGSAMTVAGSATNSPTYSVIGTLPPGMTLNTTTGQMSGTPTQAGTYAPTLVATNSWGKHALAVFFRIYPNNPYPLSVTGGIANVSTLTVGASANLTANAPPPGQIFNGWSILNGYGTLANWRATSTSVRLDAPGALAVKANFTAGNQLTVVNGTSTPLGGGPGAAVTITADPDGVGTMFGYWSTTGPGTIAVSGNQTTTFTMGAAAATVTANFVPGYRLNVYGGNASAPGGLPGTEISVWPGASPGPGYSFEGFWLEGPGYLFGNGGKVVMGAGMARLHAAWWPTGSGPLTRTLLQVDPETNVLALYMAEPVTFWVYTDFPNNVGMLQQIDYSTDGGNTWVLGVRRAPDPALTAPSDHNYRWRIKYTKAGGFSSPGRVVFRARADTATISNPIYFYMPLHVLNVQAATILTHPSSVTVPVGQKAQFQFSGKGNGGYDVGYQWRKNGVDIPGQSGTAPSDTLVTYTIDNVQPSDAGVYTVAIRSGIAGNWVSSDAASLTIGNSRPRILTQPVGRTVNIGDPVSLTVVATGYPNPNYQWYKDYSALVGETASTLSISAVRESDAGDYSVEVANSEGSVHSSRAEIKVLLGDDDGTVQLKIHRPN